MSLDDALDAYTEAGEHYALKRAEEMKLEDERHIIKQAALLRIMATTNELTGKPHSASSAESVVQLDAEYAEYLGRQREAAFFTILARTAWESARLRAQYLALLLGSPE